jgi:hypothetical protein
MQHKLILAGVQADMRTQNIAGRKLSEALILAESPMDESVIQAQLAVSDAKASVSYWQALESGIKARGSSLKRLAELTMSGYLAPSSSYQRDRDALAQARQAAPPIARQRIARAPE